MCVYKTAKSAMQCKVHCQRRHRDMMFLSLFKEPDSLEALGLKYCICSISQQSQKKKKTKKFKWFDILVCPYFLSCWKLDGKIDTALVLCSKYETRAEDSLGQNQLVSHCWKGKEIGHNPATWCFYLSVFERIKQIRYNVLISKPERCW